MESDPDGESRRLEKERMHDRIVLKLTVSVSRLKEEEEVGHAIALQGM